MSCAAAAAESHATGAVSRFSIDAARAAELLTASVAVGPIAVVFSQPSTHRTIQLKADDADGSNRDAGGSPRGRCAPASLGRRNSSAVGLWRGLSRRQCADLPRAASSRSLSRRPPRSSRRPGRQLGRTTRSSAPRESRARRHPSVSRRRGAGRHRHLRARWHPERVVHFGSSLRRPGARRAFVPVLQQDTPERDRESRPRP